MVYNHTSRPMNLDLSRISGSGKHIWLMNPADGSLLYIGTHSGSHLTIDPRKIPGAPPFSYSALPATLYVINTISTQPDRTRN
ncbi:putative collagen-binding domain-containing protein [Duncaniella muris]|uniref:putative collagen-binding domain-containing protein n=1 Tax=Duncaniella muris TaxID=2094150 RepID=UPI003EBBE7BC